MPSWHGFVRSISRSGIDETAGSDRQVTVNVPGFRLFYLSLFCGALVCLMTSEAFERNESFGSLLTHISTASDLLKELGYALIIAIVIAFTIEAGAKREEAKELANRIQLIHQNVFGSIFGVYLPKEIVEGVTRDILQSKFFRRDYRINFDMDICSIDVGGVSVPAVKIYAQYSYVVENATPSEQDYEVLIEMMEPPRSRGWPLDELESVFVDGRKVSNTNWTVSPADGGAAMDHARFSHRQTVPAGRTISVKIRSVIYRHMEDNEASFSVVPSLGLEFSAKIPPEITSFAALPIHEGPVYLFNSSDVTREYEWRLHGPVLPNQGIYFWWRRE